MSTPCSPIGSQIRIIPRPNPELCVPLRELSGGVIFNTHTPNKRIRKSSGGAEILMNADTPNKRLSGTFPSALQIDEAALMTEEATTQFCLAFGLYKMEINPQILEQILEYIESGLGAKPLLEVKIGLLFLMTLAFYHQKEKILFDATKKEFQEIDGVIVKYRDLVAKLEELREKAWPILN